MSAWCDFLVIAAPGGPATQHLVNAAILEALGPKAYLVNVARGGVVDTTSLAQALAMALPAFEYTRNISRPAWCEPAKLSYLKVHSVLQPPKGQRRRIGVGVTRRCALFTGEK